MKTPEEMAEEYSFNYMLLDDPDYAMSITKKSFLAGYQAAKDEYETKINDLEIELENWKHTAIHGDEGL